MPIKRLVFLFAVIQIANVVTINGEAEPFVKNIFTLKSCAPIVGAEILSYENEKELLEKWADFIRQIGEYSQIGSKPGSF